MQFFLPCNLHLTLLLELEFGTHFCTFSKDKTTSTGNEVMKNVKMSCGKLDKNKKVTGSTSTTDSTEVFYDETSHLILVLDELAVC